MTQETTRPRTHNKSRGETHLKSDEKIENREKIKVKVPHVNKTKSRSFEIGVTKFDGAKSLVFLLYFWRN